MWQLASFETENGHLEQNQCWFEGERELGNCAQEGKSVGDRSVINWGDSSEKSVWMSNFAVSARCPPQTLSRRKMVSNANACKLCSSRKIFPNKRNNKARKINWIKQTQSSLSLWWTKDGQKRRTLIIFELKLLFFVAILVKKCGNEQLQPFFERKLIRSRWNFDREGARLSFGWKPAWSRSFKSSNETRSRKRRLDFV